MPWLWIRRALATRWNVQPWTVDQIAEQAPAEIALEMHLMRIESEEKPDR